MIIRDAKKEEFASIRKQRLLAYAEYAEALPESHWQGLKQAISSNADSQDGVDMIIAEIDGQLIGSVVLFPAKTDAYEGYVEELDYPEIRMLSVAQETRGKGVAKALIAECIYRAKQKKYHTIGLHTGEFMTSAIKLYGHFGFERVPEYDFEPANDGIIVKAFRLSI